MPTFPLYRIPPKGFHLVLNSSPCNIPREGSYPVHVNVYLVLHRKRKKKKKNKSINISNSLCLVWSAWHPHLTVRMSLVPPCHLSSRVWWEVWSCSTFFFVVVMITKLWTCESVYPFRCLLATRFLSCHVCSITSLLKRASKLVGPSALPATTCKSRPIRPPLTLISRSVFQDYPSEVPHLVMTLGGTP